MFTTLEDNHRSMEAITLADEDNRKSMETMRRDTIATLEWLKRGLAKSHNHVPPNPNAQDHDHYVYGIEMSITESLHVAPQQELKRGSRDEHGRNVVERWILNHVFGL